ncbi:MAG: hypothetical protein HETSPECPRED_007188 [Heterodermia speciosa]|uniref:Uncharacterized protein n=1 Tax=Heterodermia speciosa TaxID=116794 RepID=A0A8H3EJ23_9LECA|nr:MAG: hypothetical protein HETSPECPRED_007188 [Heterodermia speciosa]
MTSPSGDHNGSGNGTATLPILPNTDVVEIQAIHDIVWNKEGGQGSHANLNGGSIRIALEPLDECPVKQRSPVSRSIDPETPSPQPKSDTSAASSSDSAASSPFSATAIISPSNPDDKRLLKRTELTPEQKRRRTRDPKVTPDASPGGSPRLLQSPIECLVAYVAYHQASRTAKFNCAEELHNDRTSFCDSEVIDMSPGLASDSGGWPLEVVRMTERDGNGNEFLKLNVGVRVDEGPSGENRREVRLWAKRREVRMELTDAEQGILRLEEEEDGAGNGAEEANWGGDDDDGFSEGSEGADDGGDGRGGDGGGEDGDDEEEENPDRDEGSQDADDEGSEGADDGGDEHGGDEGGEDGDDEEKKSPDGDEASQDADDERSQDTDDEGSDYDDDDGETSDDDDDEDLDEEAEAEDEDDDDDGNGGGSSGDEKGREEGKE